MIEMRLVREFAARVELAPYAALIADYLGSRRSARTAQLVQDRFLSFMKWADHLESTEDISVLSLPVNPVHVLRYVEELDRRGRAMTTILNYLSAIGAVHRALGFYEPGHHPTVRSYLRGLRLRHTDRGLRRAKALSEDELARVLQSLYVPRRARGGRMESPQGASERARFDRALLLTMVEGGLRRAEASNLIWQNVKTYAGGTGVLMVPFGKSSTHVTPVGIGRDCVQALRDIRPQNVDVQERVFGLSGSQITRRLKAMCSAAGVDPKDVSGNTPRTTLMRTMVGREAPTHMVLQQMRLGPPRSLVPYIIELDITDTSEWLSQRPD